MGCNFEEEVIISWLDATARKYFFSMLKLLMIVGFEISLLRVDALYSLWSCILHCISITFVMISDIVYKTWSEVDYRELRIIHSQLKLTLVTHFMAVNKWQRGSSQDNFLHSAKPLNNIAPCQHLSLWCSPLNNMEHKFSLSCTESFPLAPVLVLPKSPPNSCWSL